MSNMMDLQSALGQGPPGGGPATIQAPSLAEEVGFPGGPGAGPGGPGGPGAGGPPDDAGAGGGGSTIDYLDDAEQALHSFIQNDPDEADRAEAAKALQIVLKLKAGNQQSVQSGDMKSLQRALAGGAGGPGA